MPLAQLKGLSGFLTAEQKGELIQANLRDPYAGPVLSVSVMIATPEIISGSSPKAIL